ncbi:MAG: c-type cytochrome [Candidatus Omnitrophota bacterium]|nr:c-type cytochrome [Candidatus Omnitrophota bacterium]
MWFVGFLVGMAGLSAAAAERPAPDLREGAAAYAQSCARCHGPQGRGDGIDATRFFPRPRDLTLGVYKFRSTASGTPPTDEDLFETITSGLPGSNMPDWRHLEERVRWQLVEYLKTLSPIFDQTPPSPVQVASDPGPQRADEARGKVLYEQLGCAACHGAQGRADGPSAAGLVDDWGMPIRPANLTQGWSYRGGHDPRSVMLRVLTGIDGAGMPSYAEALSPEDAWHLAYYVASLQEEPHWNLIAHASYVEGALPAAWDDVRWRTAESTTVRLRNAVNASGEWVGPPTINAVSFHVMSNGEAAAFRVSWDDPTQELRETSDAFALILKPAGTEGDVVTLQAWPSAGAPRLDLCYWSARTQQVSEGLSGDYDSVMAGKASQVLRAATASYGEGRWHLVFQRPLAPGSPSGAAVLPVDGFTSVAFAVWDGGHPHARAVSPWVDVVLNKGRQAGGTRH